MNKKAIIIAENIIEVITDCLLSICRAKTNHPIYIFNSYFILKVNRSILNA